MVLHSKRNLTKKNDDIYPTLFTKYGNEYNKVFLPKQNYNSFRKSLATSTILIKL